jgi:hypothetical protein
MEFRIIYRCYRGCPEVVLRGGDNELLRSNLCRPLQGWRSARYSGRLYGEYEGKSKFKIVQERIL